MEQKKNRGSQTSTLTMIALMAAVLCVLSPFSIPVGVVPVSLSTFGLYLAVLILGRKKATVVCMIYLLLGFAGMPVFSGFSGGPAKLAGPTGGYLLGYLLLTTIAGAIVDKFPKNHGMRVLGLALGTIGCYVVGTFWLAVQMKIGFYTAMGIGVFPFLAGDVIKVLSAEWLGMVVQRQLRKAGYKE